MPAVNSMLGVFGLATRRQLESAVDRKDRWHGLVRNVFVPYYLKFQETALGNMPELPARYSREWDDHIQTELDNFLALDLEAVGSLLEAAGFGTEKWEKLQESGFPALSRLLDEAVQDDPLQDDTIEDAVHEDVLDLFSRHPDLVQEITQRLDPASGTLLLTDEEGVASIHDQFMGDPTGTDVISFPMDGGVDMVVSVERAERESAARGHAFEAELALYITHGILHVCGFDDTTEDARVRMRDAEREVLDALGLRVTPVD